MNVYLMAYANKNFGDDLFIRVLCNRYPQHTFFLSCSESYRSISGIDNLVVETNNKIIRKIYEYIFIWTGENPKSINIAKKCDAVVYIGGSIFIESNEKKYWKKVLHERNKVSSIVKKFYICSANFGPYTSNDFLKENEEWLRHLTDVCFRDYYSYKLFRTLPNIRVAPDVAFTINSPKRARKRQVAISCMSQFRGISRDDIQGYLDKIVSVSNHYSELGFHVVLLALCENEGDLSAARYIIDKADDNSKISVEAYSDSIQTIVDCIAESSLVIATRFHSMVVSFATKTPVFPIVYSKKTKHVIDDLEYNGGWCFLQEFASIDLQTIDLCMNDPVFIDVETVKREAERQFLIIDKELMS